MALAGGPRRSRVLTALAVPLAVGALSACGPRNTAGDAGAASGASAAVADQDVPSAPVAPVAPDGRLALRVTGAQTSAAGNRCVLAVQARNDTGSAALNVQAAWMAQTDGFGFISDYQVLGDFGVGEERTVQIGIFGAPCSAVKSVELSRAVCTVGPVQTPPQSCAGLVMLDASAITSIAAPP